MLTGYRQSGYFGPPELNRLPRETRTLTLFFHCTQAIGSGTWTPMPPVTAAAAVLARRHAGGLPRSTLG